MNIEELNKILARMNKPFVGDKAATSNPTLASVHKYLRICDLCQELAFGTQRWPRESPNS